MLRAYLTRLFALRVLGCLLGLAAILQLLDLLDQASTILTRAGIFGIVRYLAWRLPSLVTEMIPLAALLGALLTFVQLAGSLEMTAMRTAGISLWQVFGRLLPVALLISAANLGLQAELAPRSERGFADWWASLPKQVEDAPPGRLWLRAQGDVVGVDRVSLDGRRLEGVLVVQRSQHGDLSARLDAADAVFQDGRWTLQDVRIALPGQTAAQVQAGLPWPHGPLPANMVELARPVERQTVGRLLATLQGNWAGRRGPAYYRTQLQALAAGALSPLLMVLLAAPILLGTPRSGAGVLQLATALALGLVYMVTAGLLEALGEAGTLPPILAGWAALSVFAAYGALRIVQAEEG